MSPYILHNSVTRAAAFPEPPRRYVVEKDSTWYLVVEPHEPAAILEMEKGKKTPTHTPYAVQMTFKRIIQDECRHVRGNDFMRRMHLSTWHLVHLGLNGGDRGRNSTCMKLYKYSTRYWSLECIVRYQTQHRYSTCTVSYYRKLVSIASRRGN
jgi:hypothetical protein